MSTGRARLKMAKLEQWLSRKMVRRGLRVLFALTVTILLTELKLDPLETVFFDWRANIISAPPASGQVVLIGIDDKSLDELKHPPTALEFAQALDKLGQANPLFLVSMIRPSEFSGSTEDVETLVKSSENSKLIFAENDLPAPGQSKIDPMPPPFEKVPIEAAPFTRDHSMFNPLGVSRRVIVMYENSWTLPGQIALAYNGFSKLEQFRGIFPYIASHQAYVSYRNGFPHISFSDILAGRVSPDRLRGRVVLIGRDSSNLAHTFMVTPTTKGEATMSPLQAQASYIDTLITNTAPRITPPWFTSLLTFAISILTMLIVMRLRPARGLISLGITFVTLLAFSLFADWAFNWFFPVAAPLLGIVICYYFALPYRLILENRKSWEFEEKNRLLTQVEELKTNFIKLMSHDLKTPIARIQAMTEMALQEKESLSATQLDALENITYSAEELSQFIGSILNLSRVQSNRIKLHLETRDINQLLQKVVRNADHLARRKNIDVLTDFEPLFPLHMDEDLMKQVFTNLVENAIKYSPENTQVKVSAREVGNMVKVSISDQGIGIPQNELPYVFEKFYRAQNAEYENNGTGLGLYLAKYFVQLHNGDISVESAAEQGSTFNVSLPLEIDHQITGVRPSERPISGGAHV